MPPAGAAGLRWFEIVVPDQNTLSEIRDRLTRAGSDVEDIETGLQTHDPAGNRLKIFLA